MVRYGENFFKSLGFAPLPETFWERSLFVKPRDREVVCHASAWDIDNKDDLRLKMCIQIRDEDFVTVHHELGHNFYQRAYNNSRSCFRTGRMTDSTKPSATPIALSITPDYLQQVGLLQTVPKSDDTALAAATGNGQDRIPAVRPDDRSVALEGHGRLAETRGLQQGLVGIARKIPGSRSARRTIRKRLRSGAKYHVPANVPYTRYFLAHILQFQFYRALCAESGYRARCTAARFMTTSRRAQS